MKNPFNPIFFGLSAVLIWAAIPAFVKLGTTESGLSFLLVCRFLIASFIFLPCLRAILKKIHLIKPVLWLGLFIILGANYYFQGLAMIELPVSWYLVIFCLNPILSLIMVGTRLTRKVLISIIMSVVGTLLFIKIEELSQMHFLPFLYIAVGMLTWVGYTVLIKKFQDHFSNVETTAITQFVSLGSCFIIWLFSGALFLKLNVTEGASMVLLGVTTPMAYFGFNACLRVNPRFSIMSQYLEPVFGIAIGYLFFREQLSLLQFVGAGFIVVGTVALES